MELPATFIIIGDTLALSGILDYDTVCSVDKQGQQWLLADAPANCNLDLSLVSYSSSAGIALLLGWLRVARKQKKNLHIKNLPVSMAALAKVGGLDNVLI